MSASDSPPVAGVLVCHRGPSAGYQAEWTYWDSIAQAREAEAELTPCGTLCIGVHSVARLVGLDRRRRPSLRTRTTSTTGADRAGT
ncbi:hypothetical protein [Mycobacterium sp. GA-1285]|uniref:hypothetical protein n=1 Tax=Mycobacteriaceae TaxID=1762 RepID=UPI000AC487AD|nr:hypothetical protein [Mycobacterium sp. GA-1285]